MKKLAVLLLIFIPCITYTLEIKGLVLSRSSKEAVASGVATLKQGAKVVAYTALEATGEFYLEAPEAGRYSLEIRAGGYYAENRDLDIRGNWSSTLYLSPQPTFDMGEQEVVGAKDKGSVSRDVVTKKDRQKAITSVTGDPLKALTALPGVDESGRGFVVRGGTGLENAALLDGMLIYHPYHTIIPDSVFIDELVASMSLYKGVIPPQYGQAMSSLLDIQMEDGKPGFHGKANLGLVNTYLTLNGATADGKWSYIGGLRRTHYDLLGSLIIDLTQPDESYGSIALPYYLDSQGKLQYKDKNDTIQLYWFYTDEPTKIYVAGTVTNTNNGSNTTSELTASASSYNPETMLNLRWKHTFNNDFFIEQNIQGSYRLAHTELYFDTKSTNSTNTISAYEDSSELGLRYKGLAMMNFGGINTLRPGFELVYLPRLNYTNVIMVPYTNVSTGLLETTPVIDTGYQGSFGIYSAFLEDELSLLENRFTVLGGLRASYYDFAGRWAFDPRLTVQAEVLPGEKIYGAWGYMSELTTDPETVSLLSPGKDSISIPGCYHYVLGNQWQVLPASTLTVEGYFKDYRNSITARTNNTLMYQTEGLARQVYGYEVFWKQKPSGFPLHGWLGVGGYMVREKYDQVRNTGNTYPGQLPAAGEWVQGANQVEYKLNLTVVWDIVKDWTLTGELNWKSGDSYTPVIGAHSQVLGTNTVYIPEYGPYLSAKYPDVHSVNLKLEKRGELFGLPMAFYVQVFNVYNYQPVNGYSWNSNYTVRSDRKPFFGIVPTAGFWLEW